MDIYNYNKDLLCNKLGFIEKFRVLIINTSIIDYRKNHVMVEMFLNLLN